MAAAAICAASWAAIAARCDAHGNNPVTVHVVAGTLSVTGGLSDDRGYARNVFADCDESGVFDPAGSFLLTTLPSFALFDLADGQELFLEVLSRPDFTKPTVPARWLWYWNPATMKVVDVPNNPQMSVSSNDLDLPFSPISISQSVGPTGPLHAGHLDDELGQHSDLLSYALPISQSSAVGTYGFFARLTAPGRGTSVPFLAAFNHALPTEDFQKGALAINAAARLPGDYDGDDDSDGNDFAIWQRTLTSTTQLAADGNRDNVINSGDLKVWLANFGRIVGSPASAAATSAPEPSTLAIAAVSALIGGVARRAKPTARSRLGRPWPAPAPRPTRGPCGRRYAARS
jgi:hypothetical protein